jgi:hypothetical protein
VSPIKHPCVVNALLIDPVDCRRIAVLRPDLSDIPKESFERRQSPDGDPYYRIHYTLEMSFDTVVSFRLRYDGERISRSRGQGAMLIDLDARQEC